MTMFGLREYKEWLGDEGEDGGVRQYGPVLVLHELNKRFIRWGIIHYPLPFIRNVSANITLLDSFSILASYKPILLITGATLRHYGALRGQLPARATSFFLFFPFLFFPFLFFMFFYFLFLFLFFVFLFPASSCPPLFFSFLILLILLFLFF